MLCTMIEDLDCWDIFRSMVNSLLFTIPLLIIIALAMADDKKECKEPKMYHRMLGNTGLAVSVLR